MKTRATQAGFTLIEIMVVVVILGILAAIVVPRVLTYPDEARVVKAKQDILALQNSLDLYKLDSGFYPTTDQGLQALSVRPTSDPAPRRWKQYIKSLPKDPWGRPYQYLNEGDDNIKIFTYGKDGKPGGTGYNAEIGNWNLQEENQP